MSITVNGQKVVCLIDTGANIVATRKSFIEKLNIPLKTGNSQILNFESKSVKSLGVVKLTLDFEKFQIENQTVYVFENLSCDLICGGNIFSKLEILRNPFHTEIRLNDTYFPCGQNSPEIIKAHCDFEIMANSFKIIEFERHMPSGVSYFADPILKNPDLQLEPCLSKDKILLAFSNLRPYNVLVRKNTPLAEISPSFINNLEILENSEAEEKRLIDHNNFRKRKFGSHKKNISVKFGSAVPNETKSKISEILNRYRMAFSSDPNDIGLIKNFRYRVDLQKDAKSWYQAPRRIGENVRVKLAKIFESELDAGLISEGSSEHNTPLVVVRKSSGELRICLDLRALNRNILVEKFPLPDLYSVLNKVSRDITEAKKNGKDQKLFLSRWDLSQAYRQLECKSGDNEKLAFSFDNKQFLTNRMPFGVSDAPSTFSRLMSIIFRDLNNVYCYLDDLVILSVSEENLVRDVQLMLEKCVEFGITLKPSKCVIGENKIELLGYELSQDGIGLIPNKVQKVIELPEPRNRDDIKSIVASFTFYREFCPGLLRALEPLYAMLRKGRKFRWGKIERKALKTAKNLLSNFVRLNHRNPEFPLILVTDASNVGTGGVLYQKNSENKLEPLGFTSKIFSPQEQKMSIRDRELLSVYRGIKAWEHIFIATPVHCHTDHKSLEFFQSTKFNHLSLRSRNIISYLNRFEISIVYIAGNSPLMATSDMLSRAHKFSTDQTFENFDTDPESPCDNRYFAINTLAAKSEPIFTFETYKSVQDNDPEISKLKMSPAEPYQVINGLLYKSLKDRKLVVLPEHFLTELVNYVHVEKGHLSGQKLYKYLRLTFTGPRLRQNCLSISSKCLDCISVKTQKKLTPEAIKIPDVSEKPFDRVFCDLVDFGQRDASGYRYGLTYMCGLTRYCDLIPIKNKTPKEVCQGLLKLFCRYGIPENIVHDNGSEFIAKMTSDLFEHFAIYNSKISPFCPSGNKVERAHKLISELLKLYHVPQENWSDHIHLIMYLYNCDPKDVLNGSCPFQLLFLRNPKSCFESESIQNLNKKWQELLGESDEIFRQIVKVNVHNFDLNGTRLSPPPVKLKKGQRVLVFKPLSPGQSKKCSRKWSGPYRVVRSSAQDVYILRSELNNRRLKRNIKLIRILPDNSNPVLPDGFNSGIPKLRNLLQDENSDSPESGPVAPENQSLDPEVSTQNGNESDENSPSESQGVAIRSSDPAPNSNAQPATIPNRPSRARQKPKRFRD